MKKILLIEDEFIIAKDLQITLQKDDFAKIDIAKNYETANALFTSKNFDLIIDTTTTPPEEIVENIVSYIEKMKSESC